MTSMKFMKKHLFKEKKFVRITNGFAKYAVDGEVRRNQDAASLRERTIRLTVIAVGRVGVAEQIEHVDAVAIGRLNRVKVHDRRDALIGRDR